MRISDWSSDVCSSDLGRAVGCIGERLGLPSATLSFHLNRLRQAGLVSFRRDGRSLIYTADFSAMNALMGYLTENCCGGDPTDCGVGVAACAPSTPATIKENTDPQSVR